MAYIQDISLLMKELLKVPKDCTPTAVEISKYIRTRYRPDKKVDSLVGSRAYSSTSEAAQPVRIGPSPNAKKRSSRRNISSANLKVPTDTKANPPKLPEQKPSTKKLHSKTYFAQKRQFSDSRPKKAPTRSKPADSKSQPRTAPESWSWRKARSNVHRAVSDMLVPPNPATKLTAMASRKAYDPRMEKHLEMKKKEALRNIIEHVPHERANEPIRTREVIQKLLDDNKLEVQRREIAKLMSLARSKMAEAKKQAKEEEIERSRAFLNWSS